MDVTATIKHLRNNDLTYCSRVGKLETLHRLVADVEARAVPGIFVEAGVAMGGSACVIAKSKRPERELRLYDVFDLLPPPSAADGPRAAETYERFRNGQVGHPIEINYLNNVHDMLWFVRLNMYELGIDPDACNVRFVKGLYQDTLHIDRPVAFAHIDCDWHDSVAICIERIGKMMSPGGVMLFDDYQSFEGCRRPIETWLRADRRFKVVHDGDTVAVELRAEAA
jgi:hypothetical protein